LVILLCSFQCDPDIEFVDNERLLFSGTVVDDLGNPIENVPVKIYASRNFFDPVFSSVNANDELLGNGQTDSSGAFSLVTLSPSNALNIYGLINIDARGVLGTKTPLVINSINFLAQEDFTYALENLTLEALINFDFRIERTTNTTDTLRYSLRYKPEVKSINFDEDFTLDPILINDQSLFGELPLESNERRDRLTVRQTDTIFLEYQLVNNQIIERDSLEIVVNKNGNSFVFRF